MRPVSSEPEPQLDLLAAALRADTADLKAFVEILARKLTDSFPSRVTVQRKGLPGTTRPVRSLAVTFAENQFELDNDKGQVATRRRRMVRGVALNTEELRLDAWIDQLSAALVEEAGHSENDRLALQQLLEG
jgi:hypothetical protein